MTTILLLDGEPAVAEAVRRSVAPDGVTVEVCGRASEAAAALERSAVACVVTDLAAPDARGPALLDKLAAARPGLAVIALAPHDQHAQVRSAHRAAIYDVCAKPIETAQLAHAVRRATERHALVLETERLRTALDRMGPGPDEPGGLTLEQIERRHILRVVTAHRGNKAAAAQVLGVDRKTLYRKLLRYGEGA